MPVKKKGGPLPPLDRAAPLPPCVCHTCSGNSSCCPWQAVKSGTS